MIKPFLCSLISVVFLLSACGTKADFSVEKKSADSLKAELITTVSEFNRLDSSKINMASAQISAFFNFINPRIKDTITREEAAALSELKSISKALGKYIRTKKELARFYNFNIKQIDDLIFDLENSNIDNRDSASKFLSQEIRANNQLLTMMKLHNQIIPNKLRRYDSIVPLADDFVRKINNGVLPADFIKKITNNKGGSVEEDD